MPKSTASSWSVAGSQVKRAEGFGMPAREVDGHDFFEVYEVAGEVIERARAGGGPSLLHVRLNRYYGHFEGDAQTYRVAGRGRPRAPVDGCDRSLPPARHRGLPAQAGRARRGRRRRSRRQIATAVAEAKAAPQPTEADLLTDVYVRY